MKYKTNISTYEKLYEEYKKVMFKNQLKDVFIFILTLIMMALLGWALSNDREGQFIKPEIRR